MRTSNALGHSADHSRRFIGR